MGNARVAGKYPIGFEKMKYGLGESFSLGGELLTPGWVADCKINGVGSNSVLQIAEVTVVN
jgi:hypothetical protein